MQELDNLVKSLEKNIRILLEKITKLQKLNFENNIAVRPEVAVSSTIAMFK